MAPLTAPGCSGHSPSARDRISDTVLRMVGITAVAAAGGSQPGTLHLSLRRAQCSAAPRAPPPTQASVAAGNGPRTPAAGERGDCGEGGDVRPQSWASSLLQPPRGRLGGAEPGAGAGGEGRGRALTRSCGRRARGRERGGEKPRGASFATPTSDRTTPEAEDQFLPPQPHSPITPPRSVLCSWPC